VDSIVNGIPIKGRDPEKTRELLTGVITASLCDTVIQTWSDGELPGLDEVENVVAENAAKAVLELSGLPEIAGEVLSEVNRIASGQPDDTDTLKRYKDACETVLAQ
jgi:hypothetical protein